MKVANVEGEYKKFPELAERREDVLKIMEWTTQEPHLPNLDEREVILFFHACHYLTEVTKQVIDLHFTTKTHCPEFFTNTDPLREEIQMAMKVIKIAPVEKRTPTGHKIALGKFGDVDASKFSFADCVKFYLSCLDMVLAEDGIASGHVIVVDMTGLTLGHLARIGLLTLKKYLFFLQEASAVRIGGFHFINSIPVVDKLLAMMKPFMKEDFYKMLHVHTSLETFYKFVPKDILPVEYGGPEEPLDVQSGKGKSFEMKAPNVEDEYKKFPELAERREEVLKIMEWTKQEPHLPNLDEREVILFFHACHYHTEVTKQVIDLNFTTKTHCPELFANTDPLREEIKVAIKVLTFAPIEKRNPAGHKIGIGKFRDSDASKYNFADSVKLILNCLEMLLAEDGIASGHVIALDMTGITLGHLARIGLLTLKKTLFFLQEAAAIRIGGFHFINSVPLIDKFLGMMKPFMKEELFSILHVHTSLETFYKFVPKEILPVDYGGPEKSLEMQSEKFYKKIMDNREFFINQEATRRVNEKLRPGKSKSASDLFGTEGNFRKLAID